RAEDGIRNRNVTGVETCALPIFEEDETGNFIEPTKEEAKIILAKRAERRKKTIKIVLWAAGIVLAAIIGLAFVVIRKINQRRARSEERRVGKEWRYWRSRKRCGE